MSALNNDRFPGQVGANSPLSQPSSPPQGKKQIVGTALREFALSYFFGDQGLLPCAKKAFEYFKLSADVGNSLSMCDVSYCYQNGIGTPLDAEKAATYKRKAIENGISETVNILGVNVIVNTNPSKRRESEFSSLSNNYNSSAEAGESKRKKSNSIPPQVSETNSDVQAFKKVSKDAKEGDLEALVTQGYMYLKGRGTKPSAFKAFKIFKDAADRGHSKAVYKVGELFEYGIGTNVSFVNAHRYYAKAKEKGIVKANESLRRVFEAIKTLSEEEPHLKGEIGYMYETGSGTTISLELAFKAYKECAESGNARAEHQVANMYRDGQGTEPCHREAYKFYDLAIMHGNLSARQDLDSIISQRFPEYMELLQKKTDSEALVKLAKIHKTMGGRSYSSAAAFGCLHEAADKYKYAKAQYELGMMYEQQPTKSSQETADFYYQLAAKQGYKHAKLRLITKYGAYPIPENFQVWTPYIEQLHKSEQD